MIGVVDRLGRHAMADGVRGGVAELEIGHPLVPVLRVLVDPIFPRDQPTCELDR